MHPERLGPYRIKEMLGRGGLGVVYRAVDQRTEDEVAVKLLVGASAEKNTRAAQRFLREFHSLADLDHPHVVRVIEAGLAGDMPFFSMELVEGLDIKRHVDVYNKGLPLSGVQDLLSSNGKSKASEEKGAHLEVSTLASRSDRSSPSIDDDDDDDSFSDLESSDAFDMNAWLVEPDSDALLGREVSDSSGVIGAIGPAPSIDLPLESVVMDKSPFDLPPMEVTSIELNEPIRLIRVRELIVQVCGALAYVHSRGLVHRDLKPSNILVDEDGDARLMDFGLCKSLTDLSEVTDSGQVVGTYRYMSPEQACGEPLDARSDLYSLGVVIYELLSGRPPFTARSPMQLWEELLEREPPSLVKINPGVDQRLAQVVHALLRKDPSSRLQTAEEVLEAVLE